MVHLIRPYQGRLILTVRLINDRQVRVQVVFIIPRQFNIRVKFWTASLSLQCNQLVLLLLVDRNNASIVTIITNYLVHLNQLVQLIRGCAIAFRFTVNDIVLR